MEDPLKEPVGNPPRTSIRVQTPRLHLSVVTFSLHFRGVAANEDALVIVLASFRLRH